MISDIAQKSFGTFIGFFIFANFMGAWTLWEEYPEVYLLGSIVLYLCIMLYEYGENYTSEISRLETIHRADVAKLREYVSKIEQDKVVYKNALSEVGSRFPTLLELIEEYDQKSDQKTSDFLRYKKHPSPKGAEVVKEETKKRREAEKESKKSKLLVEYYESIAPFLLDLKEDVVIPEDESFLDDYTEEEKLDPAVNYLTKEEFRKLSSTERNQRALERFWKRPKSKALIGRLYERYVGYLFEQQGYNVEYVGIFKGYEDLGRDLICSKGKEMTVIQCKNWSQFRTIYEKHIFQFFGTVFQYKDENKDKSVNAIFYTTTKLSDIARRFAKELKIGLQENHKFDQGYPCIKCNISRVDGTKIYHLPFDQQYDKVKIEPHTGEFYCSTVEEAEKAGFRRAFRYKGLKK